MSLSNVFVFVGGNEFQLFLERKRWVHEFKEKHGDANLLQVSGPSLDVQVFFEEVVAMPFAASKRLIVIEGIPKFTKEDLQEGLRRMRLDVLILFILFEPDRRLAMTKELLKVGIVREFHRCSARALRNWAEGILTPHVLHDDAWQSLLGLVGEDQFFLFQELQKLSLYTHKREVTQEDVESIGVPAGEMVVWRLTDLLGAGRATEALHYTSQLLERGGDPQSLWSILLWMLRNLVLVRSVIEEKGSDCDTVTKVTGLPPLAVRAILPLAKKITIPFLEKILMEVVKVDGGLKSGVYRATSEEPEELMGLIDRFILRFVEHPDPPDPVAQEIVR